MNDFRNEKGQFIKGVRNPFINNLELGRQWKRENKMSDDEKKKRGWYYDGKQIMYWRNCDYCGKEYRGMGKHFCSYRCSRLANPLVKRGEENGMYGMGGEKSPVWKDGISNKPYSFDFDKELKELIRKRDNYTCQRCGKTQEQERRALSVHHIDYDKENSNPKNLITLCEVCNVSVNFQRDYWTTVFNTMMLLKYEEAKNKTT